MIASFVLGLYAYKYTLINILCQLFFILLNNWLGLFPGVGTIGFVQTEGSHLIFVPFFRGAAADLNLTLALAIMAVLLTHIVGVVMTSSWSHLNRFVGLNLFQSGFTSICPLTSILSKFGIKSGSC